MKITDGIYSKKVIDIGFEEKRVTIIVEYSYLFGLIKKKIKYVGELWLEGDVTDKNYYDWYKMPNLTEVYGPTMVQLHSWANYYRKNKNERP